MATLILASTSPWRRQMLETAGIAARSVAPGVPELPVVGEDGIARAERLGREKAEAVFARFPEDWVLGADQVLVDEDGSVWGKPKDDDEQRARLAAMRGRWHSLVTGYAILTPQIALTGHIITRMHVRADLTEGEIAAYVATGEARGCAGGYAAEGLGLFLFDAIEGDWFNVVGLPMSRIIDHLRTLGWRFGGTP